MGFSNRIEKAYIYVSNKTHKYKRSGKVDYFRSLSNSKTLFRINCYKMSSQGIAIRRVSVTSPQDMPTKGIAETPGGTIFGTTPGGTRIIYDRLFLLKQKGSNLSRTPPVNLPAIPGVTQDLHRRVSVVPEEESEVQKQTSAESVQNENIQEEEHQEQEDDCFEEDMEL